MDRPTPRVNASNIAEFTGRIVRIIGKVISLDGDQATIEASDGGQVVIKLTRETTVQEGCVEVIGRVNDDISIQEFTSVYMGDNTDMNLVEQVVALTHAHPTIFPTDA